MAQSRTLKITSPLMRGNDVDAWRSTLVEGFRKWNIHYPLNTTGPYNADVRAATASFMRAWGVESAGDAMAKGLSPSWRIKLRNNDRSTNERHAFESRKAYRAALRTRFERRRVSPPIARILDDSWGYNPPVHDGIDLICGPKAALLAICRAEVVRADAGGWWGKGAPSPDIAAKGDGIIILRSLTSVGPFKEGLNFGYGHAESPAVKVGEVVEAGEFIGRAGLANAWHVHFMANGRSDTKGVGDRDPRPYLDYAVARG